MGGGVVGVECSARLVVGWGGGADDCDIHGFNSGGGEWVLCKDINKTSVVGMDGVLSLGEGVV
jgi:hypothetical protein